MDVNTRTSKLDDPEGYGRHRFSRFAFGFLFLFLGIPAMVVFAWVMSLTIKHDTAFHYLVSLIVAAGTDFFFFICTVLAVGKLVGWALIIRYGREERLRQKGIDENVQEMRSRRLEVKAQKVEQKFIERMGEDAQKQELFRRAVNKDPEGTTGPLLRRLRNSQFVRFFFPKVIPGDIVTTIYTDTFWFSFWTILIISFPYYFLSLFDNQHVQNVMREINDAVGSVVADQKQYRANLHNPHLNICGSLLFFPFVYAWFIFDKNVKKIPPTVLGTPKERIRLGWSGFLCIPAGFIFVQIGKELEKHSDITLSHLFLIVLFAGVYGFIGVNFARMWLVLSAVWGWRKTVRSMWNR